MSDLGFPLRLNTTNNLSNWSPSCLSSVHIMISGCVPNLLSFADHGRFGSCNRFTGTLGFCFVALVLQLESFGGGMYFETVGIQTLKQVLWFSEAVDPLLFWPLKLSFQVTTLTEHFHWRIKPITPVLGTVPSEEQTSWLS
ncbi:hypothetical protein Tco_1070922 [Tanacetum coccineum]|uniref:Uncharacterized protein n=1 Tax=Tanacetum coccineum TaxID=301880 RepID=A0ABQ5HPK6_9ASTR